ncbi:MAG: hypothetical protein HY472_00675 [Candidatus Sungbacteria bacterium]|nr:hypothetical protein [Candidatus Sungbacteria bacterium]
MNYFLYGADAYRSRKKLREIVDAYRKKSGSDLNLVWIDAEDHAPDGLEALAGAPSLFGGAKLGIIERPFTAGWEPARLRAALKRARENPDTTLVLWERELQGPAEKSFQETKNVIDKSQEFVLLLGSPRIRWIRQEAEARGISLSPREIEEIGLFAWDSWGIVNELEKRALGSTHSSSAPRAPATVFQLGDAFFSSPGQCLSLAARLIDAGEDPARLFSYLANYVRTVALVRAYADRRLHPPAFFKIHPFVVKKSSAHGRSTSFERLSAFLQKFFDEEHKIKTGVASPREALERILAR